jgi:hypothetical protein
VACRFRRTPDASGVYQLQRQHAYSLERSVEGSLVEFAADDGELALAGDLKALEGGSHRFIEGVSDANLIVSQHDGAFPLTSPDGLPTFRVLDTGPAQFTHTE